MLTHENAPRIPPAAFLALLQEPVVHFAGQPVALVLAETPQAARAAAASVEVRYAPMPAITALDQARETAFAPRTAGLTATDSRRGEPEAALAAAAVALDRRYTTPTHNHLAIEPQVVLADWDGSQLTVHTPSQAVFAHRTGLAKCFGLDVARVRVISSYLGGGFGSKGGAWFPCLVLACLAARQLGRPVRLELTRAQMFTLVGRRQETVQRLQIGTARDGRIDALLHDTVAQTSTYGEYADPVATPTRMMYACANVATTHRLVRVNAPQPNPARAPGEGPGSFALESALDELAYKLDLDPIELRRRNFADRDQHAGLPWSSNGLLECYRVGAEAFGWARRPRTPGTLRDGPPPTRLGHGGGVLSGLSHRLAGGGADQRGWTGKRPVRHPGHGQRHLHRAGAARRRGARRALRICRRRIGRHAAARGPLLRRLDGDGKLYARRRGRGAPAASRPDRARGRRSALAAARPATRPGQRRGRRDARRQPFESLADLLARVRHKASKPRRPPHPTPIRPKASTASARCSPRCASTRTSARCA